MILVDAIFIMNNSGAKVLLDYLIENLEKSEKQVCYLLDDRLKGNLPAVKTTNLVIFQKASIIKRNSFYLKHKKKFTSVFCFANLPPTIKLKSDVYTYFHQKLFLNIPQNFSLKRKIIFSLKIQILKILKNNTNKWLVQTQEIKRELIEKYRLNEDDVLLVPFYPPLPKFQNITKVNNTYLYASHASDHKNHEKLIEAFTIFNKQTKKGKLVLTISKEHKDIYNLIETRKAEGINIENIGFVERSKLSEIYQSAEFAIYPSLAESFGLGIVEAIEKGCKIIGADLPYTYAVCEPSIVFNPYEVNSIIEALLLSLHKENIEESKSKVRNNIEDLMLFLK